MKAAIITKYGNSEFLKIQEVEKPIPKSNEVLIKVYASSVTAGDIIMRKAGFSMRILLKILGFKNKKIPGTEFSGVIEAVGKDVTQYKVGNEVFGTTTGLTVGGASEYICLPETWRKGVFTFKPFNTTFEEAAATVVGGMTALQLLRKATIQRGSKVMIYGASGSVGTFAVQLAKYFGAEVTGVCSTSNFELVRSLGADHVLDYKAEEFSKTLENCSFDIVFDAVGKLANGKKAIKSVEKFISVKSMTSETKDKLDTIKELTEEKKLKTVIDKSFTLDEIVEAHKYVEKGHKRGNVVISIN